MSEYTVKKRRVHGDEESGDYYVEEEYEVIAVVAMPVTAGRRAAT